MHLTVNMPQHKKYNLKNISKKTFRIASVCFGPKESQLPRCDILFFCHDVDRGVTLLGKAYSPLIDSLRDYFEAKGVKCLTIAHPFSHLTGLRAHGSPISINRTYFFSKIITKISQRLSCALSLAPRSIYRRILKKTNAKIIITIDSRKEMCAAAHAEDVFCIELLHGISHTRLPNGWDTATPTELPHGVLCLSQQSSHLFSRLIHYNVTIKTIPHPFLRRFTKAHSSTLPREWSLPKADTSKFKKEILISLMWGYAGDHGPNKHFAGILDNGLFYEELSSVIINRPDIFWRFRLHPVQMREAKYSQLRDFLAEYVSHTPNTEWEKSSTLPLPSLALHCSGNISMASSACYDVASMGLKSLMLCPTLQKGGVNQLLFEDLILEGYAKKGIPSRKLISDWVDTVQKTTPRAMDLDDDQAWNETTNWILQTGNLS